MVARGVKVKVVAEPALSLVELVGVPLTVSVTVLFELASRDTLRKTEPRQRSRCAGSRSFSTSLLRRKITSHWIDIALLPPAVLITKMVIGDIRVTNCYERSRFRLIEGHLNFRIGVIVVELRSPPRLDYAVERFKLERRADNVVTPRVELATDNWVHDGLASCHGRMLFTGQPCEIHVLARGRNLTRHLECVRHRPPIEPHVDGAKSSNGEIICGHHHFA